MILKQDTLLATPTLERSIVLNDLKKKRKEKRREQKGRERKRNSHNLLRFIRRTLEVEVLHHSYEHLVVLLDFNTLSLLLGALVIYF